MNKFWQHWLSIWAIGVALFGLVLAGGAFGATDGLTRTLFALFGNPVTQTPDMLHRFAIGLMGAVTMGWGLTFYALFKALHALDTPTAAPLWRLTAMAAAVWYLVDSTISIATGYTMNAVSNTVLMLLFLVPLIKSGAMKS
jgi:hypothetical protein